MLAAASERASGAGRGTAWAVALVALALVLPFAGKAFHIDEVYYIEIAQNILKDPLQPFAGAVALEDIDYRVFAAAGRCPDTFAGMSHPPLVPYLIALVVWLTGRFSEVWLHLAFAPFAAGAALATLALARRFTRHPAATTLLVVATPIMVLGGQALMTDLPAVALSLCGLALFIEGLDHQRPGRVLLAGVLVGLAVVTRYTAVTALALILLYGFSQRRLRKSLLGVVGVVIVFGAWCAQNLIYHGRLHVLGSLPHYRLFYANHSFDWAGLVAKALGDPAALGGTAFAAALLVLVVGGWQRWLTFGGAALAALALFVLHPRAIERLDTYAPFGVAAVAACFGLGVVLLTEALRSTSTDGSLRGGAPRLSDQAFLIAWLLLTLMGAVLLLPFGTARYMLPVLPPLGLLLARRADTLWPTARARRAVFLVVIGQGAALAGLLSLADAEYAGRYRALAASVRASYPSRTIWFIGEWGFRYYMGMQGARYLRSTDDTPQPGDIIIRPEIAGMHAMAPALRRRSVRVQEIELQSRWPVRLMSFDAKAGYYSHHWGFLPFAFSHAPLERVELFEVRGAAPPARSRPCASS